MSNRFYIGLAFGITASILGFWLPVYLIWRAS